MTTLRSASAESYFDRGGLHRRARDLPMAVRDYRAALELCPSMVEAHGQLGEVLNLIGQFDEAARHLRTALELGGRHHDHNYSFELEQINEASRLRESCSRLIAEGGRLDLSEATFLIPLRIDTRERIRNLRVVLQFIASILITNVIVCEECEAPSRACSLVKDLFGNNGQYFIIKNNDSCYMHRTKQLNEMINIARNPYVVAHDSDVILFPGQYAAALRDLKREVSASLPFNGVVYNITGPTLDWLENNGDPSSLNVLRRPEDFEIVQLESAGGAVFLNKNDVINSGGYNENFLSWGGEDKELEVRFKTLKKQFKKNTGPIYHLDHPRTLNSRPDNPFYQKNLRELDKTNHMDATQLQKHILSGGMRSSKAKVLQEILF